MEEILKQIEKIEGMQLDTRTECFMQLQQVKKLKILLQQKIKNLNSSDVVNSILQELEVLKKLCVNNDNAEAFMWRKAEGVEEAIKIVKKYDK